MSQNASGEADSDSTSTDKEVSECPTCGDTFATLRGMRCHHAQKHGESISGYDYTCSNCGETITRRQQLDQDHFFCSGECEGESWSEHSPNLEKTGIDHPSAKGEYIDCDMCETTFYVKQSHLDRRRFCSQKCLAEYNKTRTGEDHHRWKGGSQQSKHYSGSWFKARSDRLEKDNYACVVCGKGKDELGRNPDVHHVVPVLEFNNPDDAHTVDNLITLCREHHMVYEGTNLKPDVK